MTREEAIAIFKGFKFLPREMEAVDMAIKALQQEPCEDAISRQAALEAFGLSEKSRKYGGDHSGYDILMKYEIQDILEALPPVTPQPKTGKWIDYSDEGYVECPFCGHATNCEDNIDELHYCFYCGEKMESEE